MMVVTTGAIRHAKASVKSSLPTTNTQFFTVWMSFLSLNRQCQSTEGKSITVQGLANSKLNLVFDH